MLLALSLLLTVHQIEVVKLIANGAFEFPFEQGWSANGVTPTKFPTKGPKFRTAIRLVFSPRADQKPEDLGIHAKITQLVHLGDTVSIRAWMKKSNLSSDPEVKVSLAFEQTLDPFAKLIEAPVVLTEQWKEYRFAAVAKSEYLPGEAQFSVFLGFGAGSMDIGNVQVEDVGDVDPSTLSQTVEYFGGKQDSGTWKAAAEARIEKFRKAPLEVDVVDLAGHPLPGVNVEIKETHSAFRFGTAVPASLIVGDDSDSKQFQEILEKDFNTVTFEDDLSGNAAEGQDYADLDRAVEWMQRHQMLIRAANLVWNSNEHLPKGLWDLNNDQIKQRIRNRIHELVDRFKGKVYLWDVTNQSTTTDALWNRIGWNMLPEVFQLARSLDGSVLLAYSDYSISAEVQNADSQRSRVLERVRQLKDANAPLDVIDMKCHVVIPMTQIPRVIESVEDLAKLGKKLEVTEFDLGVSNDKVHGKYSRDFLTAMFSEPAVDGFILRGFWEGSYGSVGESGAMYRKDWSPRPAAKYWEELVLQNWRTHTTLRTDVSGCARARVFLGTYEVTASQKNKTQSLMVVAKAGSENKVILKFSPSNQN